MLQTSDIGLMGLLPSWRDGATVATVVSGIWLVATKLNPRNNWCVFALGGMPGESGKAMTHRYEQLLLTFDTDVQRQIIMLLKSPPSSDLRCHARVWFCVFQLPVGVLEVNSGSKWNVSSGLPTVGLNGGLISLRYSFCWEKQQSSIFPH